MSTERTDRKTFRLKSDGLLPPARKPLKPAFCILWCCWGAAFWMAVGRTSYAAPEKARPVIERYNYTEMNGALVIPIAYEIERGQEVVVRVRRGGEEFYNQCDLSGATIEWRYRGDRDEVAAHVDNRTLVIGGTRNGKPFQNRYPIGEAPWFQPLSYALRPFSRSGQKSVRFWLIRTDNLEPVKMKAVNSGAEEILVNGRRYRSIRIDVSPSGPLSFVWRGSYWFRESDGVFLQYAGGHVLSGPEEMVIRIRPDAGP